MIHQAPKPNPLWVENESDHEQRRAAIPGLAWGWLQRTIRSGEAAIKLEKSGYASEAAPLVRSALEHAMRLYRAGAGEGDLVEVAMLAKKGTSEKLVKAQHDGWRLDPAMVKQLQQYVDADTSEFDSLAHLVALKKAIDTSPDEIKDRLKSMYLAWLFNTASSHPTIDTAEPYIDRKPGSNYMAMLSIPRPAAGCAAASVLALLGATEGYSRLTGLEAHFDPALESIIRRYTSYFADI